MLSSRSAAELEQFWPLHASVQCMLAARQEQRRRLHPEEQEAFRSSMRAAGAGGMFIHSTRSSFSGGMFIHSTRSSFSGGMVIHSTRSSFSGGMVIHSTRSSFSGGMVIHSTRSSFSTLIDYPWPLGLGGSKEAGSARCQIAAWYFARKMWSLSASLVGGKVVDCVDLLQKKAVPEFIDICDSYPAVHATHKFLTHVGHTVCNK